MTGLEMLSDPAAMQAAQVLIAGLAGTVVGKYLSGKNLDPLDPEAGIAEELEAGYVVTEDDVAFKLTNKGKLAHELVEIAEEELGNPPAPPTAEDVPEE